MSYWRGHTGTTVLPTVDDEADDSGQNAHAFEQVPTDKELGIQLNHVSKVITKQMRIQCERLLLLLFSVSVDLQVLFEQPSTCPSRD